MQGVVHMSDALEPIASFLSSAEFEVPVLLQVLKLVAEVWQKDGLITRTDSLFLREAARILKNSLELVVDADRQLRELLDYPLAATLEEDEKAQACLEDNFTEVTHSLHLCTTLLTQKN